MLLLVLRKFKYNIEPCQRGARLFLALLFVWPCGVAANASSHQLEFVLIDVGGQMHGWRQGDVVRILRGDRFRVIQLFPGAEMPLRLELEYDAANGSRRRRSLGLLEVVDTEDFPPSSSHVATRASITALNDRGKKIGALSLEIIDPEVFYVILTVNGTRRIARPDRLFLLDEADAFMVESVITNISDLDNLSMEIYPVMVDGGSDAYRRVDMMFFRGRKTLARVPLRISLK